MKGKVIGAVIGVALCIWNEKRTLKHPHLRFEDEFIRFLQTCKGHLSVKKEHWTLQLEVKKSYSSCIITKNNCVIYTATYGLSHALIQEERYYRMYTHASSWNTIEKELDGIILPYFKQTRLLYLEQEEERRNRDKPFVHALQKQLRVVKVRGW